MGSLSDKIKERKRLAARVNAVGQEGVRIQDARRAKIDKIPKEVTKDVQKRIGEYKRGRVDQVIDKVKVYK